MFEFLSYRQDAMMTSCAAADTPVLFNCLRISGTLTSVVERVGDGIEWGRWEGSVGPFVVLVLLVVELSFSWPLGYHDWVGQLGSTHIPSPLSVCFYLAI